MEWTTGPIKRLTDELSKLPSIGRKSASRLVFHILKQKEEETALLYSALKEVKEKIRECRICFNYAEEELCPICNNKKRNIKIICVIERPADIPVIERGGSFSGVYHILGGVISPIDGITPDKLKIRELLGRIDGPGYEVILSMGTGTEGEHTAIYLTRLLKELGARVTRIARGLPAGSDLQYMDEVTLLRAIEGRVEM